MRLSRLALLAALLCAPEIASAEPSPQAVAPAASESSLAAPAPAIGDSASLRLQEPELKLKPGWGRAAGNAGLGLAVALTGLTVAAAVYEYDYYHRYADADVAVQVLAPALLGNMLLVAILAPVVAIGSASSRNGAGVEGSPGMRGAAWLAYILNLFSPIALGVAYTYESPLLIVAVAGVGITGLVLHSFEARIASKQARQKLAAQDGLALDLFVAPTVLADGRVAPSFGLTGRF